MDDGRSAYRISNHNITRGMVLYAAVARAERHLTVAKSDFERYLNMLTKPELDELHRRIMALPD